MNIHFKGKKSSDPSFDVKKVIFPLVKSSPVSDDKSWLSFPTRTLTWLMSDLFTQ